MLTEHKFLCRPGMGYNDVSLAMQNVSVQFLQKVERSSSGSSQ